MKPFPASMVTLFVVLLAALRSSIRSRLELEAETLALRRQLAVLQRQAPKRQHALAHETQVLVGREAVRDGGDEDQVESAPDPPPYAAAISPLECISVDQTVRFDKPSMRGTRITVDGVLSYLAAGMTAEQIVAECSQLSPRMLSLCAE